MYNNNDMVMLINCRTPLQRPPGSPSTVRCGICQAISPVAVPADYRSLAPPPYNLAVPNVHGRKRAVVCGISYRDSDLLFEGCINDAKCIHYLLTNRFHIPHDSIIMLIDPYRIPTKANMRMAMYWLVQGCQPGDSLVLHFSGHGCQQWNPHGKEADWFDENLVPVDFQTEGMIVDDEINATFVRPLPPGVRLHALMDCCHSGTALDLLSDTGHYVWEDHRPVAGTWKGTSGGGASSFSGCDDHLIQLLYQR